MGPMGQMRLMGLRRHALGHRAPPVRVGDVGSVWSDPCTRSRSRSLWAGARRDAQEAIVVPVPSVGGEAQRLLWCPGPGANCPLTACPPPILDCAAGFHDRAV